MRGTTRAMARAAATHPGQRVPQVLDVLRPGDPARRAASRPAASSSTSTRTRSPAAATWAACRRSSRPRSTSSSSGRPSAPAPASDGQARRRAAAALRVPGRAGRTRARGQRSRASTAASSTCPTAAPDALRAFDLRDRLCSRVRVSASGVSAGRIAHRMPTPRRRTGRATSHHGSTAAATTTPAQDYVLEYGELRFTFNERTSPSASSRPRASSASSAAGSTAPSSRTSSTSPSTARSRTPPRPRRARQRLLARARRPGRPLARALAAPPRLPLRVARPAGQGGRARRRLRRDDAHLRLHPARARPRADRARPRAQLGPGRLHAPLSRRAAAPRSRRRAAAHRRASAAPRPAGRLARERDGRAGARSSSAPTAPAPAYLRRRPLERMSEMLASTRRCPCTPARPTPAARRPGVRPRPSGPSSGSSARRAHAASHRREHAAARRARRRPAAAERRSARNARDRATASRSRAASSERRPVGAARGRACGRASAASVGELSRGAVEPSRGSSDLRRRWSCTRSRAA